MIATHTQEQPKRIVVGITGSSGTVYAQNFLRRCPDDKFLIMSKWGKAVAKDELGLQDPEKQLGKFCKNVFADTDLTAPFASGSNRVDTYVILPASTSTIGKIASGIGDTLITRTAAVCLKERYKMIVCVRETPLSTITLEQLATLSREGAIIMPISPPLYYVPKTVEEYVQGFVDKVLQHCNVNLAGGWRAKELE